jgi:hypothetical protein
VVCVNIKKKKKKKKSKKKRKGGRRGKAVLLAVYSLSHRPYASFFRFQFPDPYPVEKKEERRVSFFFFFSSPYLLLLLQFILSTAFGSSQTKESCFFGHGLGRGLKSFFFPHLFPVILLFLFSFFLFWVREFLKRQCTEILAPRLHKYSWVLGLRSENGEGGGSLDLAFDFLLFLSAVFFFNKI